jgi:hypothetical protein
VGPIGFAAVDVVSCPVSGCEGSGRVGMDAEPGRKCGDASWGPPLQSLALSRRLCPPHKTMRTILVIHFAMQLTPPSKPMVFGRRCCPWSAHLVAPARLPLPRGSSMVWGHSPAGGLAVFRTQAASATMCVSYLDNELCSMCPIEARASLSRWDTPTVDAIARVCGSYALWQIMSRANVRERAREGCD